MDWDELESACADCRRCPLWETRTKPVFEAGARGARLMLIGEAPGANEDLTGEPFVGRAGKLLDDMLAIIGLDRRENVYMANILKCRPPNNRDPLPAEREACVGFLRRQIELIDPKIIVCLGRIAAWVLIKPDFKITREHGRWFDVGGRRCMAIYHPSALLRSPHLRPETFDDLKELRRGLDALSPETAG